MQTVRFQFEELPGFHRDGFYAGAFNGVAALDYFDDGEWYVTAITLECRNEKLGPSAQGALVELSPAFDEQLWAGFGECLRLLKSEYIADAISADMERRGVRVAADQNAEHRIREAV